MEAIKTSLNNHILNPLVDLVYDYLLDEVMVRFVVTRLVTDIVRLKNFIIYLNNVNQRVLIDCLNYILCTLKFEAAYHDNYDTIIWFNDFCLDKIKLSDINIRSEITLPEGPPISYKALTYYLRNINNKDIIKMLNENRTDLWNMIRSDRCNIAMVLLYLINDRKHTFNEEYICPENNIICNLQLDDYLYKYDLDDFIYLLHRITPISDQDMLYLFTKQKSKYL